MEDKGKVQLILIRGIPGSGKSTYAKKLMKEMQNVKHYEADMFFEKDGEYKFDPSKLKQAHEWCQAMTYNSLRRKQNVIVSNTFTTLRELEPYLEMVDAVPGVEVKVITVIGNFGSIHDVPKEALDRMKARWQDFGGDKSRGIPVEKIVKN